MHAQLGRRLTAAADDLRTLGAEPQPGTFVCPLCLQVRAVVDASRGHYPARSIPSEQRRVELLCAPCNSFVGRVYENDARDFITGVSRMSFTAARGGIVRGRVESRGEGAGARMRFLSPKLGREFARMRDRSNRRNVVRMTMVNLDDRAARRALLAWSLLDWFHFAGYRYLASPGAALARTLVFQPLAPAPQGLWLQGKSVGLPLPAPQPVLLARVSATSTSLLDADELIALGTRWGGGMCVLPFASDASGGGWERIAQVATDGDLAAVRAFPLRALSERLLEGGLHADMRLTDAERDIDVSVTLALSTEEAQALCAGTHGLQRTPRSDAAPLESGTRYEFDVVGDGQVP